MTPATAQTVQPISVSMTECHVLLGLVAENASGRRTPDEVADMQRWSDAFGLAAVDQAKAEGRSDPTDHVLRTRDEVEPKWERQVRNPLKLSDTLDWTGYCRALGRDRGVLR